MLNRLLARVVSSLHTAFALFVVLGGLLVLRWPSLLLAHLLALLWAVATLSCDLGCYLTHWEKALWRRGGVEPYAEGFLQHHILRSQFSPERSRRAHLVLGAMVLALNVVVYSLLVWRWQRDAPARNVAPFGAQAIMRPISDRRRVARIGAS